MSPRYIWQNTISRIIINCYKLLASRRVHMQLNAVFAVKQFWFGPMWAENRSPQHSVFVLYKVFYTAKRQVSDSAENVNAHHSPSVAFALSCKLWLQEVYYTIIHCFFRIQALYEWVTTRENHLAALGKWEYIYSVNGTKVQSARPCPIKRNCTVMNLTF